MGRPDAKTDPVTDGFERRAEERTICNIEARVELSDRFAIACRIKDLSPSGFQMQISDVIHLPDEFDLLLPVVQGVEQRCRARLVWRTADMAGGAFLTPLGQ